MTDKEIFAQWMIQHGYATGHGDTIQDLLVELDIQIVENWTRALVNGVQGEREACAEVCDHEMDNALGLGMKVAAGNCADKIRARGAK